MVEIGQDNSLLKVGTILHGTYRIERYLSSGGFGNTYVAKNINFDEVYAVKEFFMRGVSQREGDGVTVSVSNSDNRTLFDSQKNKFRKEAVRLRKLDNPHIVRVHDLFEENGTVYYVMDFIEGMSLRERMNRAGHPMDEKEVLGILRQVLDALDTVHKLNIYHLDIKPANIMVDNDVTAKLIYFGASKQLSHDEKAFTSTSVSYTNGYAPSEQVDRNLDNIGPWTDFYALGATLYNLLTGNKPPLPSDIIYDETPDKRQSLPMPPIVSQGMHDLVIWLMQGNRKKRPQSVSEIYAYIDKNLGSKSDTTEPFVEEKTVYDSGKPAEESHQQKDTTVMNPTNEEDKVDEESEVEEDNEYEEGPQEKKKWLLWTIAGVVVFIGLLYFLNKPDGTTSAGQLETTAESVDTTEQQVKSYPIVVPEAIDLGLSVKWASFNLGASKQEETGNYYAWGETTPETEFDPIKYKKYPEGSTLKPEDDAAAANLGCKWRMPTYDEINELISKCEHKWTTINGINGIRVTGPNGKSIFFPASGFRYYSNGSFDVVGSNGYYWSASASSSTGGRNLTFNSGGWNWSSNSRALSYPVRPVLPK